MSRPTLSVSMPMLTAGGDVDLLNSPSGLFVRCRRHDEWMRINLLISNDDVYNSALYDAVIQAKQSCPKCIEEIQQQIPPTRWPEGAEL